MAETTPLGVSLTSGGAAAAVTPSGSPFIYANNTGAVVRLNVSGGTVSLIEVSVDGGTVYLPAGLLGGTVLLGPNDRARITYVVAPVINLLPL